MEVIPGNPPNIAGNKLGHQSKSPTQSAKITPTGCGEKKHTYTLKLYPHISLSAILAVQSAQNIRNMHANAFKRCRVSYYLIQI